MADDDQAALSWHQAQRARLVRTGRTVVTELRSLEEELARLGTYEARGGDARRAKPLMDLLTRLRRVRALCVRTVDRLLDDTQPVLVEPKSDGDPR